MVGNFKLYDNIAPEPAGSVKYKAMQVSSLSKLASILVSGFDKESSRVDEGTISVNPVVAEVATWFEKFRTAMDYREDELILRSAIERILKRRLLLGGSGETVAPSLVRELLWARYFPEATVSEKIITEVARRINLYLRLQELLASQKDVSRREVREWILQLLSSDIADILNFDHRKELMSNFIFQIFKDHVDIVDGSSQDKDVQVFIALRRAYGKEDLPLLRYHLFVQYFGKLGEENIEKVADRFLEGYSEINRQLNSPLKDKVYTYVKNQVVPFYILEDVLRVLQGRARMVAENAEQLDLALYEAAANRYRTIFDKVRRAIFRSVIFILFTKALFALAIEGTYESIIYGGIQWSSIAINTAIPPLLMVVVGLSIKVPGRENTKRIVEKIHTILFEETPILAKPLVIKKPEQKTRPLLVILFTALWMLAFILSFGGIIFVLTSLRFNIVSQAVFIFFLAIVSFISYRINQTANMYTIRQKKENIGQVLFDFFFMPIIDAGRRLTLGISQLNIFLFVFDFLIEAPFKSLFAFFEEWFLYLRSQREKLD